MKKTEVDCEVCENKIPQLDEETAFIFSCLCFCETQVLVAGMGGIYGLNYAVVFDTAKALGIEVNEYFLRLLKAFESVLIKELSVENKADVGHSTKSNNNIRR